MRPTRGLSGTVPFERPGASGGGGEWALLGFIPIINFLAMYYFMGAANLKLERKIDALLAAPGRHSDAL